MDIWTELCPCVAVMKPATDLCFTCQSNANLLIKSANLEDSIKSQRLKDAQEHIALAKVHYNEQCKKAKECYEECSGYNPSLMHYSFDFAQQVHFPFNSQQPGPIFFKMWLVWCKL